MKRSIIYTSGTQLIIQAVGLFTGILVARLLGPEGRGQLAAVITWGSMLVYLANLGLPAAYCFSAAREPNQRHQLLGNGVVFALVQWVALIIIGLIVLPPTLSGQGALVKDMAFWYLCAYAPLNLVGLYIVGILQGSAQFGYYNLVRMTVPVTYAIFLLFLWAFNLFSVGSVVIATVLSNAVTLAVGLMLILPALYRLRVNARTPWLNRKTMKRDLRYGLSAQIGTMQPFSGLRVDVLFLTVLVGAADLGLYVAALAAVELLRAQGYALGQVVFPEVAKHGQMRGQVFIIRRFAFIAAIISIVAIAVVLLWAKPLLWLVYGKAYTAAAPALKIMICGGALATIYRVLADGFRGMGKPLASTIAEFMALAVGIAALAVCVPLWGINGAAVAVMLSSSTSLCVMLGFIYSTLRRGYNHPISDGELDTHIPSLLNSEPTKHLRRRGG